jgi:hypothetical protein
MLSALGSTRQPRVWGHAGWDGRHLDKLWAAPLQEQVDQQQERRYDDCEALTGKKTKEEIQGNCMYAVCQATGDFEGTKQCGSIGGG